MRSLLCRITILFPLLFSAATTAAPPAVELTKDTCLAITETGRFGNAQGMAAQMLEHYLLHAIKKESLTGPGPKVAFVLHSRAAVWPELKAIELQTTADAEAFEIRVSAGQEPSVQITGATALAVGFGVTHFLEHYVGVTWLFPGPLGVDVPEHHVLRLPSGSQHCRPAFVSRIFTGLLLRDPDLARKYTGKGYADRESAVYRHRHYYLAYDYHKSLRLNYEGYSSHNIFQIFPGEKYAASHPEIYPLRQGKRLTPDTFKLGAPWHPCYSNPRTTEIAVETAKEALTRKRLLTFSLGVNDGVTVVCECPGCVAAGWPQAYFRFVERVAAAVRDRYPPQMIGVLAYGNVAQPPADLRLPENIVVLVVGGTDPTERFRRWAGHAQHFGAYEYLYGEPFWIPNFPLDGMAANAEFYRQHRVQFLHAEVAPVWAWDGPKVYVRARLLWDPAMDVDAALRRYCRAAFAEAEEPMYGFYSHWAKLRAGDVVPGGLTPMTRMEYYHRPVGQFDQCTPEDFQATQGFLDRAFSLARGDRPQARLKMVAAFHAYAHTLFRMARIRTLGFDPEAKVNPVELLAQAIELKRRRQQLREELRAHPEWLLGTKETPEEITDGWEGKPAWTLDDELDAAVRTAVCFAEPAVKEVLAKDPNLPAEWKPYAGRCTLVEQKPKVVARLAEIESRRYVVMDHQLDGAAVTFAAKGVAEPELSPAGQRGKPKKFLLKPAVYGVRLDGRSAILLELEASGGGGFLRMVVQNQAANTGRSLADCGQRIEPSRGPIRRRLLLQPVFLDKKTRKAVPSPDAEQKGNLVTNVYWEPDSEQSSLSGRILFRRVEPAAIAAAPPFSPPEAKAKS